MWIAAALGAAAAQTPPIRLQAELGRLTGVQVMAERLGYSGKGYVTGFNQDGDQIEWTFPAKAGIYTVRIRFCVPGGGNKGFGLSANGFGSQGMFPPAAKEEFAWHEAGRVELKSGENRLVLQKGWGYFEIDAVQLVQAPPPPPLKPVPLALSNPKSDRPTQQLFRRLAGLYGKATLGGQYNDEDTKLVQNLSGKLPVVFGADFMDYSPSRIERGADLKGDTERMIARARQGHVITISWHWNAPKDLIDKEITNERGEKVDARWYKGFYTNATTFDVAKAMANPAGEDYKLLMRDIDVIAVELKKLQKAGVPVLWRPLHEAEGRWFWWGANGPEPCIKLWKVMHDRLTNRHGLNNLIWVWNSLDPEWYPGDSTVDMVGADLYPSDTRDANAAAWDGLLSWLNGRKMIALTEIGGAPDIERAWRFGVRWSFFTSWTGTVGPKKNKPGEVKAIYNSQRVMTLDEWRKPPAR